MTVKTGFESDMSHVTDNKFRRESYQDNLTEMPSLFQIECPVCGENRRQNSRSGFADWCRENCSSFTSGRKKTESECVHRALQENQPKRSADCVCLRITAPSERTNADLDQRIQRRTIARQREEMTPAMIRRQVEEAGNATSELCH